MQIKNIAVTLAVVIMAFSSIDCSPSGRGEKSLKTDPNPGVSDMQVDQEYSDVGQSSDQSITRPKEACENSQMKANDEFGSKDSSLNVQLTTLDCITFEVNRELLKNCKQVINTIEDTGTIVPLPNIDGETLEKILRWEKNVNKASKVATDESGGSGSGSKEPEEASGSGSSSDQKHGAIKKRHEMTVEEAKFFDTDLSSMFKLTSAADFLGYESLSQSGTTAIANKLSEMSEQYSENPDYLKALGLPEDGGWDPESLEEATKKNPWIFQNNKNK